jgi:hypothetical protein
MGKICNPNPNNQLKEQGQTLDKRNKQKRQSIQSFEVTNTKEKDFLTLKVQMSVFSSFSMEYKIQKSTSVFLSVCLDNQYNRKFT